MNNLYLLGQAGHLLVLRPALMVKAQFQGRRLDSRDNGMCIILGEEIPTPGTAAGTCLETNIDGRHRGVPFSQNGHRCRL